MTRWRWVLFDLDGTLANTIPLIIASYDHATRRILGSGTDPVEARSWIGETLRHTFRTRYPDHAEALIEAYVEFNLRELSALIESYPGMTGLISELAASGVGLGVATSKRRHAAELTLEHVDLGGAIPVTVAMDDTEVHKPDPTPLLLALERLGGVAADAVYIGDAVVDVRAAQAAGMASIAVTWGAGEVADLVAAGPDCVVHTVDELRALLLA